MDKTPVESFSELSRTCTKCIEEKKMLTKKYMKTYHTCWACTMIIEQERILNAQMESLNKDPMKPKHKYWIYL